MCRFYNSHIVCFTCVDFTIAISFVLQMQILHRLYRLFYICRFYMGCIICFTCVDFTIAISFVLHVQILQQPYRLFYRCRFYMGYIVCFTYADFTWAVSFALQIQILHRLYRLLHRCRFYTVHILCFQMQILYSTYRLFYRCRLNCMEKSAITSIMSLKATCSSCTIHQLRGATFRWNVKNFDLHTREAVNNMQWESWILSGKLPFLRPYSCYGHTYS